ncbi:Gibberellin-regulated protein 12 [Acorus calamus]|uniref:Gibberellin-regulated protein 12 n=1 Tax=Acorus calamus TaxID=4465 RepID=A0AAV9CY30_ACOCL|nr:Gibberellin-regulated protein 12 [Acorus calamus]
MGRSLCALLLLSLLLSAAFFVASAKDLSGRESLVNDGKKHHRHSGFSQAECPGACDFRCSKTQYRKPCMFFCQKCCFKCRCVPPGTYAHKEA